MNVCYSQVDKMGVGGAKGTPANGTNTSYTRLCMLLWLTLLGVRTTAALVPKREKRRVSESNHVSPRRPDGSTERSLATLKFGVPGLRC